MDYYGYDINIDETTNKALNQRHEIQEKLINIDLYNLERKLIKSQGLPRGEIHANFNPYGNDESDITAPFFNAAGYSVKESYQRLSHLNDLSIGFSVYVPILDGKLTKNRVKAIQTQIQLTEYEKEELEQNITKEIHTLVKQIENTYYMLHLLDESVTIAEKNIELSNEAFQNNKINSYLYALDIKRWEQSNLSRIEANITYNLLIKKLEYETLDNLKVINSIK
jgi:outer membrane protein TolC